jgi:hypothetical protein
VWLLPAFLPETGINQRKYHIMQNDSWASQGKVKMLKSTLTLSNTPPTRLKERGSLSPRIPNIGTTQTCARLDEPASVLSHCPQLMCRRRKQNYKSFLESSISNRKIAVFIIRIEYNEIWLVTSGYHTHYQNMKGEVWSTHVKLVVRMRPTSIFSAALLSSPLTQAVHPQMSQVQ